MTWYYDSSLANSRGLVAGNNVTISNAVDGACTISAQVTGSGATSSGSYLTMVTEASLPQSRVATQGNGITITDGGPGGAGTIGVASTITGANLLTWDSGDTIFTNRRQMLFGSGLSAAYGSNTLTLSVTGQNAGTVTSVDLAVPSFLTVSGNPITTAGTITVGLANQVAGTLLIAPSGSTGSPTFRRILGQDLPIFGSSSIAVTTNATGGLVLTSLVTGGGGSGSGTVTDLTVGNLSPIFTSNVATSTTTPAVTYTLSNAASATAIMGPKTGADAPPSYRAIVGSDLFNLVAGSNLTIDPVGDTLVFSSTASGGGGGSVTSFSAGNLSPLFTTSVATATTTPALSFTIAQGASGQFVAGPVSGANANLALRALATSDLPAGIPTTKIGAGTVDDLEFGYLDGVTSAIQTQFSNKQPLDATLTALAAYNTNGVLTQTAADTFTGRTITGTANEVTVTNGNGVSGNPTLSLASGIDATKIADGSVTSTEFQYINTLSSNAQTQIDGKAANSEAFVTLGNTSGLTNERRLAVAGGLTIQDLGAGNAVTISSSALQPLDATLTALAAYNTTGFITQTGVDTFAGRTLAAAGGLTIQESGSVITVSGSAINGTVTSFSAGDLSPLFTTTESTVTTTPALSFAAVNQASGGLAYLSPASGSAAAPSFRTIGGSDLAAGIVAGSNITITQLPGTNQMSIASTASGGSGGGGFTASTITANATAAVNTVTFVDLASGNVTVALQTAVGQGGKEIKIKIINNIVPPNTLTINCTATNGAGTIDGSSSTITSQYVSDAWTFQSANGSAWYIF